MNLFETIGIIHIIFYTMIGVFFIGRCIYLTIRQRPEQQKFFSFVKGE